MLVYSGDIEKGEGEGQGVSGWESVTLKEWGLCYGFTCPSKSRNKLKFFTILENQADSHQRNVPFDKYVLRNLAQWYLCLESGKVQLSLPTLGRPIGGAEV
jgi:hypothetical protein